MDIKVVQLAVGDMANFSYIVYCSFTRDAIVVDPSFGAEDILEYVSDNDLSVKRIVNTHGHGDHIAGNSIVMEKTGAKLAGHPIDVPQADIPLEEGTLLLLGGGSISIMHTPGHSPGSISILLPNGVITGDTLFVHACGRADFPNSDPEKLYNSIQRLGNLAPDTIVYPGHNYGPTPTSTIGEELKLNPYFQCHDLESFLKLRMG